MIDWNEIVSYKINLQSKKLPITQRKKDYDRGQNIFWIKMETFV